ncbi:MAG: hypothetical protein RIC14_05500 [Filomicrobium sp.]
MQPDEQDAIGPLGPRPPPAEEIIEVGRFPIIIEGKQIAEYDDLECQLVHRAYSYRKIETGDDVEIVSAGASP